MKNPMLLRTLAVSSLLFSIAGFSGCTIASRIESILHQGFDVYFPIQSKYFHPAGRLKSRGFYKPVLLKDGSILIASDNITLNPFGSVTSMPEIYDPKTQTTVTRSDLLGEEFTKKYEFISELPAITLQDGRVLFVQDASVGVNPRAKEGETGYTTQKQFPTAYLVDPMTGKGKFYYDQKLAHSAGQLIMKPNGNVLVFSGMTSPYPKNAGNVFEFNPKDETFKTVAHIKDVPNGMPDKPFWLLNNKEQIMFKDEFKGRPDTPFWLDKEQIVFMGTLDSRHHLVENYNTHTNTSEILARLSWVFRPKFIAKLPDGTLLESDSVNHSNTKFRIFAPKTKQYTDIPGTLHTYLYNAQLSDGNVLLIADEQIALFDAKRKTFKIIDQFNRKLFGESLVVTPADKVYLLGGNYCGENSNSGKNGQPELEGYVQDVLLFDYKQYLHDHAE